MTISVGIIGLGEVAQLMHLPLLADDPRYRVQAVHDASAHLTKEIGRRYQAAALYPSAGALIKDPLVEAVFILTPDYLHADLLDQALAAGKHVFVEKPVCLNIEQLDTILETHKKRKTVAFVGYMRRYARAFVDLKKNMPRLDEIRHVYIRDHIREAPFFTAQTRPVLRSNDVPQELIAQGIRAARAQREACIGQMSGDILRAHELLTGLASHSLSTMRELIGAPKHVIAAEQRAGGETVIVLFDYGNFLATYEAVISDIARFDAGIDVLTQDTQLSLKFQTPYIRYLPMALEITRSEEKSTGTRIIGPHYDDPFRNELDVFHDAVASVGAYKTTLEDSRADLELIGTIVRAFQTQNSNP